MSGVRVKPLEWVAYSESPSHWSAATPFSSYGVMEYHDGTAEFDADDYPNIEAAKAAAQADFDARVLACVEMSE